MPGVTWWDHGVEYQYLAAGLHDPGAILQNMYGFEIVPVVEDVFEEIGVSSRGYAFEEVAGDRGASGREPVFPDYLVRLLNDHLCIEDDAFCRRRLLQNSEQSYNIFRIFAEEAAEKGGAI
jgi:hypothetical protein